MPKAIALASICLLLLAGIIACDEDLPKPGQMEPLRPGPSAARPPRTPPATPAPAPAPPPPPDPAPPAPTPDPVAVDDPGPPPAIAPPGSVLLRWKLPPTGVLAFRAAFTKRIISDARQRKMRGDPLFRTPIARLLETGKLPPQARARLARPAPKKVLDMSAIIKKAYGDRLEGAFYDDLSAVPEEVSGVAGSQIQALAAQPTVRGEMTAFGKIRSLLDAKEHNQLSLAFGLPERHVLPGDVWRADVQLIHPPTGFEDQDSKHINRVELIGLKKLPRGERLAIIETVLAERVAGIYHDEGEKLEQVYEAWFMGRGEFLVEAGRFRRFSGRLWSKAAGGKRDVERHRALYLEFLPRVPKRFLPK